MARSRLCLAIIVWDWEKNSVVIWREWKRPLDLWMVIALLPWQITGGIMGSWLCVKSTSASDGDICSHYKCFYVKQARVFVLEGSSLPKWVSVRDKTERKGLILLLDTNKFLNNQWQFYWREHFIIKLLVHHSNWKLLAQNNITQLHGILIERSLIQIYGEI